MGSCSSVQNTPHSIEVVKSTSQATPMVPESFIHSTEGSCGNFKIIDHKNVFTHDEYYGIEGIVIFYGKYIKGIQVSYSVNNRSRVVDLMGTGTHEDRYDLNFKEDEFIDELTFYFDNRAITSLQISTTAGKKLLIGNKTNMPYKKELNLKRRERIVVGFRGLVGEYLTDLWVYHAELDKLDRQETISSEVSDY